jgi:hypothetical protein
MLFSDTRAAFRIFRKWLRMACPLVNAAPPLDRVHRMSNTINMEEMYINRSDMDKLNQEILHIWPCIHGRVRLEPVEHWFDKQRKQVQLTGTRT